MNFIVKHCMRLKNTIRRNWKMFSWTAQYGKQFQADKFHFRSNFNVFIEENGVLQIGRDSFFNTGCSITVREKVTVGRNCIFGENVKIYDHNHCYKNKDMLICEQGFVSAPVVIEDDCWIASNVVILKGVHIGKHSVVGAGVVVYKDLPAGSVVVNRQDLKFIIGD